MSESKTTTVYGNNLTRRDELAEKILLSSLYHLDIAHVPDATIKFMADGCYALADAMIAESKKGATDEKK